MEWIKTTILILLGFIIMVTRIIKYLFLVYIVWLGLMVVCTVLNYFIKHQVTINEHKLGTCEKNVL